MLFEKVLGAYFSARVLEKGEDERDRYSYEHLKGYFGGRDLSVLKRADVRAYIAGRRAAGVKLSTVQRELRVLSAAINFFCLEYEIVMSNPVSSLALSSSEPRVRWITREEAGRLILEAERGARRPHLAVFIRLALNTGCRRGELLNLEWSRVNWQAGHVLLEAHQNKSRRRRVVPLNDDALAALSRIRDWQRCRGLDTPWVFGREGGQKIGSLKTGFWGALRRAGIENFRIHDMRHTFASWLVMQGVSIYVVKELLGHASVKQTEIYAHLAPNQAAIAVQQLLPF